MSKPNVALVTGAGSGIGQAISIRLAKAGYLVLLVGRNVDRLTETANIISNNSGKSYTFQVDLTKQKDIDSLIENIMQQFGYLNILVNNAGSALFRNLEDASWESIQCELKLNLLAPLYLIKRCVSLLRYSSNPSILNISSEQALRPGANNSVYGSSKVAINYITKALAAEFKESKIRVNALLPGAVDTPLLKKLEINEANTISGRFLSADEVAETAEKVLYSSYMTGSLVLVDGGASLH